MHTGCYAGDPEIPPTSPPEAPLDRGPGIPESARAAVFRPFYRLEPSRSAATGDCGVGLAIARQLDKANGWRIELLARTGGGTEARLVLSAPPHHE